MRLQKKLTFSYIDISGGKMSELNIVTKKNNNETQFIIFSIGKEYYGIDIARINNIMMVPKITFLPGAPEYYSGIINLRGHIVPIMSLRRRMGISDDELTKESRIIILNLENGELMGIIVDSVKEVLTISDNDIEPPSSVLEKELNFIHGIGKKNEEIISICAIDAIVDDSLVS